MKNNLLRSLFAGALLVLPFLSQAQIDGEFRSAATGVWATPATWEKYTAATTSWAVATAAPSGATAIITVRTGHIVSLNTNHSFKKLTVQTGGSVIAADASERRLDFAADTSSIINNGNIGGIAGGNDVRLNIANTPTCTIGTITGTGTTSISRIRFNTSSTSINNLSTLVIDMDMAVTSSGITAWYNAAGNTNAENCVITINAGKTVTMSGALHNASATPTLLAGNYTYNINGTLDMSGTSTTTYLYPMNNAASTVTVNVAGVWKIAKLDAAYTGTNAGAVVLNIKDGGLVDASRASVLTMGSKWFIINGALSTGKLKRAVPVAGGAVTFPIGTSATAYNPIIATATTADDTLSVNVKNTLTNPIGDPSKIVSKQWDITPTGTGAGITASFNWQTADQAAAFVQANPLSIFKYGIPTWSSISVAAPITGSGTIATPYTTTAVTAPANLSGLYVVGNTSAQVVVVPTVAIVANPGSTVCAAIPVTFTATTTNITGAHYQWKVNGANVGTDAATYTSATLASTNAVTCEISYTVGGAAAATSNTIAMTITPLPVAGTISGSASVCSGTTELLTNSVTGGTWSSSNTAAATVSGTGVVSGVAVGSTTITYSVTNSCGTATATKAMAVTLGANAGTVSGGTSAICPAATTPLTSSMAGGTWSSNNIAVATVSSTGVVTGVAGGTATIAYVVTNGCGQDSAKKIITVTPAASAGTISGAAVVCTGATTTLTSSVTGGVWTSNNANVTVSIAGVVTGVTAGSSTITYTVTNTCGTANTTKAITVNTVPSAGTITGATVVCEGATLTLANTTAGGVWSNVNSSILTVSSAGVVTGVATGSDVVSYTVSNTCGSAAATKSITVSGLPTATTVVGADSVCKSGTTTLTSGNNDGSWSSATGKTIISVDGIVTGVSVGTDTVIYSITNTCGSAQTKHVIEVWDCNPSGVHNTKANTLATTLYPNPNTGVFSYKVQSTKKEGVKIIITNMVGSVVATKSALTNEVINIDLNQPAGVYFLNAQTENGSAISKINILR